MTGVYRCDKISPEWHCSDHFSPNSAKFCQILSTGCYSGGKTGEFLVKTPVNSSELRRTPDRIIPSARIIGSLHFVTGCDDLSYLRGFSKDFCMKTFMKHCDKICAETGRECQDFLEGCNEFLNKVPYLLILPEICLLLFSWWHGYILRRR